MIQYNGEKEKAGAERGTISMLNGIQGVIFDLDGTLIDSMYVWGEIDDEYVTKRLHLPMPSDLRDDIEGMRFEEVSYYFRERFHIEKSIEEIMQEWTDMAYDKYAGEIKTKPGTREFLEELKCRKLRIGIATSNSRELLHVVLKSNGIEDYFDAFCSGDDVARSKPEPDVYLNAACSMNVLPEKCLVFEDLPQGIKAGKNAGMTVCAVADDFSVSQTDYKKEIADYYIDSFYDILNTRE